MQFLTSWNHKRNFLDPFPTMHFTQSRMCFRRNGKTRKCSAAWRSGATKSRQKWAPLERPRAYRTLSTKRRTCRYLLSNEDQTPNRAHFVVPGGTSRTWGEVPGSEGIRPRSCDFGRLSENIQCGERAASTKTSENLPISFIARYLIHPDVYISCKALCVRRLHKFARLQRNWFNDVNVYDRNI